MNRRNFLKYLNEIENNKAAPLRETMNSMSSGKYGDNYTHSYYWASFSLVDSALL